MASKPIDTEKLKQLLAEYASLEGAIKEIKAEKAALEAKVQHLEEMKIEKDGLKMLLAELKHQKAELKAQIKSLGEIKDNLNKNNKLLENKKKGYEAQILELKGEVGALEEKKSDLEKEIKGSEQRKGILTAEIAPLEEELKFKESLDREIVEHKTVLEQIETRIEAETDRLEVFDAFLRLVKATDVKHLKGLDSFVPKALEQAQRGEISVDLFKKYVIRQLTGDAVKLLQCSSCGAEFAVNKPARRLSYQCPVCGLSGVSIKADLADILKSQLGYG